MRIILQNNAIVEMNQYLVTAEFSLRDKQCRKISFYFKLWQTRKSPHRHSFSRAYELQENSYLVKVKIIL